MDPKHARPTEYGSLRLVLGRRYRIVQEFRDHHGSVHPVGEEFTYRGYSYFPYDEGHTIYVSTAVGKESFISLCGLDPAQNRVLEAMHEFIEPGG